MEHLGARALTAAGLAATFVYLVWRAAFSMHDTDLWLSLPALLVEVAGFLAVGLLAWALWPMPSGRELDRGGEIAPVDAVVRVDDQPDHEVRATLLALGGVQHVSRAVIVDLRGRPSIAALAREFGAVYSAVGDDDRNGLQVMTTVVGTDQFVLLDAGDVPTGDIVARLAVDLADDHVAVVQGMGVSLAIDSAEHGPDGRHELIFERSSLNPALGRRGCAVWLGSGSLVRTAALREISIGGEAALEAQWLIGAELLAAGWRIKAPGDIAVVAHRAILSQPSVAQNRLERARAARRMVFGRGGALRSPSMVTRQRLATLAWSVRPLSGLRRVVFLALLGSTLLAGAVPFHANAFVMAFGWFPSFLYTAAGLGLLSGWTLRPGDRARWSLHSMGSACRSLRSARFEVPTGREPIVSLPGAQYGASLVVTVMVLGVILIIRGVSDRATHTLGALPQSSLLALLVVTLWVLALALDHLRVLARRSPLRRGARVLASLSATFGERAVSVVDLTPLGAGLISQSGSDVNERLTLDTVIPTRSGVTSVRIPCVVRNVMLAATGEFRIGVSFGDTDVASANALAEFCTIEPTWERLGTVPGLGISTSRRIAPATELEASVSGKMAMRLLSLLALFGVVASSVSAPVEAAPSFDHRLTGKFVAVAGPSVTTTETTFTAVTTGSTGSTGSTVTNLESSPNTPATDAPEFATGEPVPVPGAVVFAVCSLAAGVDGAWGTSDDTYSAPVAAFTDASGNYQLDLSGAACWASVSPPDSFVDPFAGEQQLQVLDVSAATRSQPTVVLQREAAAPATPTGTGSVGDTVWSDMDGNGVQQAGEPGVAGVVLTLLDDGGRNVASARSDSAGGFRFVGLAPGTYRLSAANLPSGSTFTKALQGDDPLVDSDADAVTGHTGLVALHAGESAAGLDVGLVRRRDAEQAVAQAAPRGEAAALSVPSSVTHRVLPEPADDQLAVSSSTNSPLPRLVLVLAGLLALSIMFGAVRPRTAWVR
jgi:hypothetical protein